MFCSLMSVYYFFIKRCYDYKDARTYASLENEYFKYD